MAKKTSAQPGPGGEIVDQSELCTISDICIACHVEEGWVSQLVAHGVIAPIEGQAKPGLRFSSLSIVRVAKAARLTRDLDLNPPGVALALDLLEEIEELRARLKLLEGSSVAPREPG